MLFTASAIVIVWGVAHIAIPTKSIVRGFGPISSDNRRIILMEWLMEGVLLIFLGVLVALVRALVSADEVGPAIVYRTSAVALFVMAGISTLTGARTSIGPMRLCPAIFVVAAILFLLPTLA
jgi:hypothetical protein